MRDGYYLSTYFTIDEYFHVFEVTTRHDNSVALFRKENDQVTLVHYWELERVSGIKHHELAFFDREHAVSVLNQLLAEYDLTVDDMVEIWGTPKLSTVDDYHSVPELPDYAYHGIWHLFSGVMIDTDVFHNEKILAFAVDGGPEFNVDLESENHVKYFYPGAYIDKGEITYFPSYSPATLWGYAGLRYGMKEGTLMALASAIPFDYEPRYLKDSILFFKKGSNVETSKDFFKYFLALEEDFGRLSPDQLSDQFTYEENKIAYVMNIVQQVSKEIMDLNVENAISRFEIDPKETVLSLTGGFALNCPTNSYLMNKHKFKGFMAPPCVNDSGMSLGCGLYAFYKKMGKFDFRLSHAYHGDKDDSLDRILEQYGDFVKSASDFDPALFVEDITSHPVVWFNSRAEIGPRALGNRSLLADPRSNHAKDQLNVIKQREWWRPVAPLILESHLGDWFKEDISSPYMLQTSYVKEDRASQVPAILHLDQSARVQTVNPHDNPDMYELLQLFKEATGVPILCNTSLNDKSEPIINKLEEAVNFALRKKMRVVYFNKKRIELQRFEAYEASAPQPRMADAFTRSNRLVMLIKRQFNPHNLSTKYFNLATVYPDVKQLLKEGREEEARQYLLREGEESGLVKYIHYRMSEVGSR